MTIFLTFKTNRKLINETVANLSTSHTLHWSPCTCMDHTWIIKFFYFLWQKTLSFMFLFLSKYWFVINYFWEISKKHCFYIVISFPSFSTIWVTPCTGHQRWVVKNLFDLRSHPAQVATSMAHILHVICKCEPILSNETITKESLNCLFLWHYARWRHCTGIFMQYITVTIVTICIFAAVVPPLHRGPFPSPFIYSEKYAHSWPDNLSRVWPWHLTPKGRLR